MRKLLLTCFIFGLTSVLIARTYNDGKVHNIDSHIGGSEVWVYNDGQNPTTINIRGNGGFDGHVRVYGTCELTMKGGHINEYLYGLGQSKITIDNGSSANQRPDTMVRRNVLTSPGR